LRYYGRRRYLSGPDFGIGEIKRSKNVEACIEVPPLQYSLQIVEEAVRAYGRVNVLVSNAGICPFHTFLDMPDDLFIKTQQVNFHGSFFITRAIANQMAKQEGEHRGGAIVAISSISAFFGGIQQTHYTPTKAAIKSLMESTSLALAPHGIRCNSILPGKSLKELILSAERVD